MAWTSYAGPTRPVLGPHSFGGSQFSARGRLALSGPSGCAENMASSTALSQAKKLEGQLGAPGQGPCPLPWGQGKFQKRPFTAQRCWAKESDNLERQGPGSELTGTQDQGPWQPLKIGVLCVLLSLRGSLLVQAPHQRLAHPGHAQHTEASAFQLVQDNARRIADKVLVKVVSQGASLGGPQILHQLWI